jgi:hypothetical protein
MTGSADGTIAGRVTRSSCRQLDAVTNAAQGQRTSGYPGLSADVQGAVGADAILSQQRLSTLSPGDLRQIQAARRSSALQQALADAALANASSRFASLQSLITAISSAADQSNPRPTGEDFSEGSECSKTNKPNCKFSIRQLRRKNPPSHNKRETRDRRYGRFRVLQPTHDPDLEE